MKNRGRHCTDVQLAYKAVPVLRRVNVERGLEPRNDLGLQLRPGGCIAGEKVPVLDRL